MRKKMKGLLLVGLLMLVTPVYVKAEPETFKDGDNTYLIENIDLSCAGERDYYGIDKDKNYIFVDYDDDGNIVYIKATIDNQCSTITDNQEILDLLNNYSHTNYSFYDKEIYKYVYYEELGGYRKIKLEEYEQNEQYYTYDPGNDDFSPVPTESNNISDIGSYYKYAVFGPAKSAVLDEKNITYYEQVSSQNFEKIEITPDNKQDIENNITKYYVEQEERNTITKLTTVSDEVNQILSNPAFVHVQVIGTNNDDSYYFLVTKSFNPQAIYSIYDKNGNLLFDDINHFSYIEHGIFSVGTTDKVELYNLNKDLLYTTDKLVSLHEIEYYDNTSFLDGSTGDSFSYYTLKIQEENKEESVPGTPDKESTELPPNTSDNIIMSVILGSISVIGLSGAIIYLKKQLS